MRAAYETLDGGLIDPRLFDGDSSLGLRFLGRGADPVAASGIVADAIPVPLPAVLAGAASLTSTPAGATTPNQIGDITSVAPPWSSYWKWIALIILLWFAWKEYR